MSSLFDKLYDVTKNSVGTGVNLVTNTVGFTSNLAINTVSFTTDLASNTAAFTLNKAGGALTSATGILGVNGMIKDLLRGYAVEYILANPDQDKIKPLSKNLFFSASTLILFPITKIQILLQTQNSINSKLYFFL